MKYIEFMKYLDDKGKEIVEERRDLRMVDISPVDAAQMNTDNQHGDGSLAYRKATKEEVEKYTKALEAVQKAKISRGEIEEEQETEELDEDPEGLIEDKPYSEWTIKKLRKFAEDEELHLEGTRKEEIWNEILDALADPMD